MTTWERLMGSQKGWWKTQWYPIISIKTNQDKFQSTCPESWWLAENTFCSLFYSETVGLGLAFDGEKYVCLDCGYKFSFKGDGQRHIRNIHTPQPVSYCHICQRGFRTQLYRDDHLRKTHGITQKMMKERNRLKKSFWKYIWNFWESFFIKPLNIF